MRAATTDFVAHPSDAEVEDFTDGQNLAMQSLDRIEAALASSQQDVITPLRITVRDLKASFDSLVNEQRALGFNETEGMTADLIAASNAIENIIHDDLSWVADDATSKLLVSLLTMRRYEIEYRLTRAPDAEKHFLDEVKHFNELFELGRRTAGEEGEAQRRGPDLQLHVRPVGREHGQYPAAPFAYRSRHRQRAARGRQDHRHGARQRPRRRECASGGAHANALHRPAVAISSVLIALACSWRIGRSITRPAGRSRRSDEAARRRRYLGAHSGPDARHEIGAMARTVIVFRDNMIERERLFAAQRPKPMPRANGAARRSRR